VTVLRGRNVTVECEQASFVHADGEMVGKTPLSIQMSRHAVSVLVPQLHKKVFR
jgi:diacylglycerol kinase family enzyme